MMSKGMFLTVASTASAGALVFFLYRYYHRSKGEEKRLENSRLRQVSVQLIFSCGVEPPSEETFAYAYPIALFPYVLGIPPDQVQLLMAPAFVGNFHHSLEATANKCNTMRDSSTVLPRGYHDYFTKVYIRTQIIENKPLGQPMIRIVSGRGYGDRFGGHLKCQGERIDFANMKPATCLTILDCCNSSYAVASMKGCMPEDATIFRTKFRKKMFKENEIPLACDWANLVHAFRVGWEGQHTTQKQVTDLNYDNRTFVGMSMQIGDTHTACVLAAIKASLHDGRSLDEHYQNYNGRLRREFLLPYPQDPPRSYSRLRALQAMLQEGVFPVRMDAYKCAMLARPDEWFLTAHRVNSELSGRDGDFADSIVKYVVDHVVKWHNEQNTTMNNADQQLAEREWSKILKMLGQFSPALQTVQLDQETEGADVSRSSDGIEIIVWAYACGKEVAVWRKDVEKMIRAYIGVNDRGSDSSNDLGARREPGLMEKQNKDII